MDLDKIIDIIINTKDYVKPLHPNIQHIINQKLDEAIGLTISYDIIYAIYLSIKIMTGH